MQLSRPTARAIARSDLAALALVLVGLTGLTPVVPAQTSSTRVSPSLAPVPAPPVVEALVEEGDVVAGVGLVTRIDNLVIDDDGNWLVEADTDNADTTADQVLLGPGGLVLREGQALAQPVGASIGSFDTLNLTNAGHSGWNFFLDGTSGGSDDSGVYYDTNLLIQEGATSTAPEFSVGTPYIGFLEAKINESDDILLVASVDDPAISSSVDRALVLLSVDGAGNLTSESVFALEGDTLAGQTETVADFGTGPHDFAFNDVGDVLFFADLTGSTATDGVVYLNSTLLAQEGSASPVGGRNWSGLAVDGMDLNDAGDHVYRGTLDGDTATNSLIVKNGAKFRQEGDSLGPITPFVLTSFGTGPTFVSEGGDVVWYGDWDNPDTDVDTGLFRNGKMLVREGVTQAGGVTIDTLRGVQDGFHLSDDGDWLVFEAILDDGTEGAYRISLDP